MAVRIKPPGHHADVCHVAGEEVGPEYTAFTYAGLETDPSGDDVLDLDLCPSAREVVVQQLAGFDSKTKLSHLGDQYRWSIWRLSCLCSVDLW